VIAPLFNKFEPIEAKTLEDRVRMLMKKVGLQIKGVFKMDASKRSKHTNAFFMGVGKTKRIVLFDTLLQSHPEEVLVCSPQAGHWKTCSEQIVLWNFSLFFIVLIDWPLVSDLWFGPQPMRAVSHHDSRPELFYQPLGVNLRG
jgi:STE24 endopeptidase